MNAPQWRLQIIAGIKSVLRERGFRGSGTRFCKVAGNRRFMVQPFGGSDQHDTGKLAMEIYLGVHFLDLEWPRKTHLSAYMGVWHGWLYWTNSQGTRELFWRAYSDAEALEVTEGIRSALPPALDRIEERFQTWHDVLPYLDKESRLTLDPPGRVHEWMLPDVF